MPYEEDFVPDADGLREALRRLIEVRSEAGSPHIDPALPLDVPQQWPAVGLGGLVALEHLKGPALEQVSRLDHPGFFASQPLTDGVGSLLGRARSWRFATSCRNLGCETPT